MRSLVRPRPTLKQIIQRSGVIGAKIILDAGDADSYPGGQLWKDVSGNGLDFYLGTTSGVDVPEARFEGQIGDRGPLTGFVCSAAGVNQHFQLAQANPAWISTMHSSTGKVTAMVAIRVAPVNGVTAFSTSALSGSGGSGMFMTLPNSPSSSAGVTVKNAGVSTASALTSQPATLRKNSITLLGIEFTGAAAGDNIVSLCNNGACRQTVASAVVANANAASISMGLGGYSDGDMLQAFAMWDRRLTIPEMLAVHRHALARWPAENHYKASA
jgi:hypothetical protein